MRTEKKIKQEIFKKIIELFKLKQAKRKFIPGQTLINYGGRVYNEKELISLVDAALDFWLTAGKCAREFEKRLAEFLGLRYCLLVNSGSSANLLAITALTSPELKERRLQAGDEVITTACGFPTTLNPIIQNKLTPVFIDIELGTYNIMAQHIEKAISKKTKAIFIAHTLGNPASIGLISKIAKKYKLWLIEDNCNALGSKYKGRYTGTFGDISTCSFYPAHMVTMGEGGAVFTNDALLRQIIISLRDWGRACWCEPGHDNTCGRRFDWKMGELPFGYDHKYIFSHIGYNLKITDLQAAIGLAQLEKVQKFIQSRKENFTFLYNFLKSYTKFLILPKALKNANPCWFGFPILIKENAPFKRKDIIDYLEGHKIATRMLLGGNLLRQPAYKNIHYRKIQDLTNSDLVTENLFWIGVYPGLNKAMLSYIKNTLSNFFRELI